MGGEVGVEGVFVYDVEVGVIVKKVGGDEWFE